jgi:hypothetical protein
MKGRIHLMHLFRILLASSGVGSSTWIWEKSLYDSSAYCVGTFGTWIAAKEVVEAEAAFLDSNPSISSLAPEVSILLSDSEDIGNRLEVEAAVRRPKCDCLGAAPLDI